MVESTVFWKRQVKACFLIARSLKVFATRSKVRQSRGGALKSEKRRVGSNNRSHNCVRNESFVCVEMSCKYLE